MRNLAVFSVLVGITLSGVIPSKRETNTTPENVITTDTIPKKSKEQSLKKISCDDFPVTDEMFEGKSNTIKSGKIASIDKAWFRNDTLNQTLVFELYTDDYRNIIYHFRNNDIPKDLVKRMELHTESDLADEKSKEKKFPAFIRLAHSIDQKYFRSNKGFKLGNSKEKAMKVYGKPDKISKRDNVKKYEWDYIGDTFYDPKKDKGKKIAKNSYGHQVILFFRNNKLIGLILHNDIP